MILEISLGVLLIYLLSSFIYAFHCIYVMSILSNVEGWFRMPIKREIIIFTRQGKEHYRKNLKLAIVWPYPVFRDFIKEVKKIFSKENKS
mgnify:CR=1 FL=1